MCGIVGWAGDVGLDESALVRMQAAVAHRGPDDDGRYFRPGRVALGFRRLSIIDLETGAQPLGSENDDVLVTCNGEIYNYPELTRELTARGHSFRSRSDVETLVHLYEERGPAFVEALQGMFAIALWDEARNRLVLARDRLGVKPLYWARVGRGIVYGSEPGAILASGTVTPSADPAAIVQYLTLQYVPAPRTGFEGISKLAPGERLVFEDAEVRIDRYWTLTHKENGTGMSEAGALDQLDELLRDATRSRLISDVPLGAFLSGGIDSSLVVSYMAELLPVVSTFTINFAEPRYGEGAYADRIASMYGTKHEVFTVTPELVPTVMEITRFLGEPFADSSAVPTYALCRLARRYVTVALSGDGGDEAFAGYLRHAVATAADRFDPAARVLARTIRGATPDRVFARAPGLRWRFDILAANPHDRYATMVTHANPDHIERLCLPEFLAEAGGARSPWDDILATPQIDGVNKYLALDTATYLPGDILTKVDRMSMAHALEVRSPFLDYRLYEFAATLPMNLKLRRRTTKYVLRELARRRGIPEELVGRSKRGFGVPIGDWFRGPLQTWLTDVLRDPRSTSRGLFRPGAVATMIEEHTSGRLDHTTRLWNLLMLESWHRTWIDAP
jgi:asparagine synthase (glutamine-hydrolysing)